MPPLSSDELFVATVDLDAGEAAIDAGPVSEYRSAAEKWVERIPVEASLAAVFGYDSDRSVLAVRGEADLQGRLHAYLTSIGHTVVRHRIRTTDDVELFTDLYDETRDVLIEVKNDVQRQTLRMALGQILDYQRYVNAASSAVLVPVQPAGEMIALLGQYGVDVVWPHGAGFVSDSHVPWLAR
ncbi:hypothetical protein [Gordonia liuliyuniae]|uniref:Restriction endonuclease n=1 Tax=Gordonia liuliyuniae TaxID=2911517 RepID=A0ABS9IY45_9ACTN|nr:hypothetical protein [Gordonia liuliyuniae]MCF8590380.1 hypothetical protein [Gordonia liuliyuniae]